MRRQIFEIFETAKAVLLPVLGWRSRCVCAVVRRRQSVALGPATIREMPRPLRLTTWVVGLLERKASSVTVPD